MRDDAALDHGAEADCVEQVAGPAGAAGASGEELGRRAAMARISKILRRNRTWILQEE